MATIAIIIWWWVAVKKSFAKTNEEAIEKFIEDNIEKIWPKIDNMEVKRFRVYISEEDNTFSTASYQGPKEVELIGDNLKNLLLKRAAEKLREHRFYQMHPIAVISIKPVPPTSF